MCIMCGGLKRSCWLVSCKDVDDDDDITTVTRYTVFCDVFVIVESKSLPNFCTKAENVIRS